MITRIVLTAATVFAVGMAARETLHHRADQRPVVQTTFSWHGRVAPGKTIEIRGVNGDVDARPASGTEVEVSAVKRGRRNDPSQVRIAVVPNDGDVTICAVYPSRTGQPENECRPGGGHNNVHNNDVQVHFTVQVPAGVLFNGNTVNGDVTAKNLKSNLEAHTVNGGLRLSTSGYARGSTVNGSIRATLGRSDWTGDLHFSTVNGSITLELPAGLGADVHGSTVNGGIESDFPVTIQGRFGPRSISGVIGGGGRELSLKTVNGSIHLRQVAGQGG